MTTQSFAKEQLKKHIKALAEEMKLSSNQYSKISNDDLWGWIVSHGKTRFFTELQMKRNRQGLPKMYQSKVESKKSHEED